MRSSNLSAPLKGFRPYNALLGLNQASGLAGGFDSLEREPPAMQVGKKEFYLCPENKPPDDRAQTGSPTVYKLAQREVIQMDMISIA